MDVCFYNTKSLSNVIVSNVMFFNFNPDLHHLSVKLFDGTIKVYEDVEFISNAYDSNMDGSQHEILPS